MPPPRSADELARAALAVVGRLGALAAPTQRTVDGAPGGVHRAARRGGGMEFADHRDYSPGDDLRHLDWRAYARSDRYMIKRFEQEVHASVTLVLDPSASMDIAGGPPPGKWATITLLCAALCTWIIGRGDAVGLLIAGRNVDVPPAGGRGQLRRLVELLATTEASGQAALHDVERNLAASGGRRGTVVAVSDLLTDPALVVPPLARLRRVGVRVQLVHCVHPVELDLNFGGDVEFFCAETERLDQLDPRVVRGLYIEMMQAHISELRERAMNNGIGYLQANLADPTHLIVRELIRALAREPRAGFAASGAARGRL